MYAFLINFSKSFFISELTTNFLLNFELTYVALPDSIWILYGSSHLREVILNLSFGLSKLSDAFDCQPFEQWNCYSFYIFAFMCLTTMRCRTYFLIIYNNGSNKLRIAFLCGWQVYSTFWSENPIDLDFTLSLNSSIYKTVSFSSSKSMRF